MTLAELRSMPGVRVSENFECRCLDVRVEGKLGITRFSEEYVKAVTLEFMEQHLGIEVGPISGYPTADEFMDQVT